MNQIFRFILIFLALAAVLLFLGGFVSPYLAARKIIRPPLGTQVTVTAFAYAPSPHQTDATPCLTASGARVRRGTLATNFLPFGTIVKINDQHYIVEDRMHPRYNQVVDVFVPSTSEALAFGRKTVTLTVVAYGKAGQKIFPLPAGPKQATVPVATPEAVATVEEESYGRWQQWQGGLSYLQRLLRAGALTNVNRYDVSCFKE